MRRKAAEKAPTSRCCLNCCKCGKNLMKKKSDVGHDNVVNRMRNQLADIGCKLHVQGDGNCLFRALSDQIFGDQDQHEQIRHRIVNFMEHHRNDFEPFIEDEEKFEKYCDRMRDDGTWGGNQELYAAARLFQVYVIVHQNKRNARIVVIECDQLKPVRFVHVAYRGNEHYDSVRAITDPIEPNTLPVSIELDCDGFRSEDFANRWQTQTTLVVSDEQRIVPTSSTDPANDDFYRLACSLGEQLQIAAGTGNSAADTTLSKKEQRQLRNVKNAARKSARKLRSTLN